MFFPLTCWDLFFFIRICFAKFLFQIARSLTAIVINFFIDTKYFSDAILIEFKGNMNQNLANRLQEN